MSPIVFACCAERCGVAAAPGVRDATSLARRKVAFCSRVLRSRPTGSGYWREGGLLMREQGRSTQTAESDSSPEDW